MSRQVFEIAMVLTFLAVIFTLTTYAIGKRPFAYQPVSFRWPNQAVVPGTQPNPTVGNIIYPA